MKIDYSRSIIEIILGHAERNPDRDAIVFDLGEGAVDRRSYRELAVDIRELAGAFSTQGLSGARIGLLFSPGLDFVLALLGCLAAGSVAVPIAPIGRRRARLQNLLGLAASFDPHALLLDKAMARSFGDQLAVSLGPLLTRHVEFDSLAPDRAPIEPLRVGPEDLAVLQFTSGTTSNPKGVMITHGNILADETIICSAFGHDGDSHFVGWVPHYHDQGLFGNILQPLFLGSTCVLTSPAAFINKPMSWLQLISRYRAHTSGGPNFGFDLCADHAMRRGIPEGLDLSCWRVAFNGAERVRPRTMSRFADLFAGAGFDRRAFLPCYGLAECTLVSVAMPNWTVPLVRRHDSVALSAGTARETEDDSGSIDLACCGPAMDGSSAIIVDTATRTQLPHGKVGEVWLSGPHIAVGYWDDPKKTQDTFGAHLATGEGPFLRTGDIAFSSPDGIYIVGRMKDLIILRGRNYAPSDVEQIWAEITDTVGQASAAAVQLESGEEQHVALIAEVKRTAARSTTDDAIQDLARQLRSAAMEKLELGVTDLVLVQEGAIPRTTSGKVQRILAGAMLMEGTIAPIGVAGPLARTLDRGRERTAAAAA